MKKSALILLLGLLNTAYADNSVVWSNSYSLEAAKKYSDALSALNSISETSEEGQLLLLRRGWLTYLQGQYNDSFSHYQDALEQNPKSLDAALGATLPLLAQQRWQEAAAYAKQALDIAPNNYTALLRLIIAEEAVKDWTAMAKNAKTLVDYYPSDTTAFVYLARAKAWLGDKEAAKQAYSAVLNRLPKHLEATNYLNKNS